MSKTNRIWEIDLARGVAILMMLTSNFLFDLYLFSGCKWCYSGFWLYFARVTAGLFLLLVGISLTLSYSNLKEKSKVNIIRKYIKRGSRIFALGILITIITFVFIGDKFIRFGILHLIGIGIMLSIPFLNAI